MSLPKESNIVKNGSRSKGWNLVISSTLVGPVPPCATRPPRAGAAAGAAAGGACATNWAAKGNVEAAMAALLKTLRLDTPALPLLTDFSRFIFLCLLGPAGLSFDS